MKAADIKEREKLAREIVNRFLGESAPEQVNVDAGSVRSTREKVEAGYFEEDLFSAAHKVALGNMEWDSARYYVTSTFYKDAVTEREKLPFKWMGFQDVVINLFTRVLSDHYSPFTWALPSVALTQNQKLANSGIVVMKEGCHTQLYSIYNRGNIIGSIYEAFPLPSQKYIARYVIRDWIVPKYYSRLSLETLIDSGPSQRANNDTSQATTNEEVSNEEQKEEMDSNRSTEKMLLREIKPTRWLLKYGTPAPQILPKIHTELIQKFKFLPSAQDYFDLHIETGGLAIDLPSLDNESLITSLALYNVATMEKTSSDFVLYPDAMSPITSSSETCVVPIKECREEYYLVIILSKEMQEDQNSLLDLYAKMKTKEVKEKEKAKIEVDHPTYKDFYQPFAWAVCPIFSSGKLITSSVKATFHRFTHNGDVFALLEETHKKKTKPVAGLGTLNLSFSMHSPDQKSQLDSFDQPKKNSSGSRRLHSSQLLQFEFETSLLPPNSYFNDVYINIESLSLKPFKGKNFCVEIKLFSDDKHSVQAASPLSAFHPKFHDESDSTSSDSSNFLSSVTSNCGVKTGGSSALKFFDDFWVSLPVNLTTENLVFCFYQLSDPKEDGPTKTPVGYSVLPLMHAGKLLQRGRHHLPVTTSLSPGYLAGGVQWMEGGKQYFTVSIELHSCFYSSHPLLKRFLSLTTTAITSPSPTTTTATSQGSPMKESHLTSSNGSTVSNIAHGSGSIPGLGLKKKKEKTIGGALTGFVDDFREDDTIFSKKADKKNSGVLDPNAFNDLTTAELIDKLRILDATKIMKYFPATFHMALDFVSSPDTATATASFNTLLWMIDVCGSLNQAYLDIFLTTAFNPFVDHKTSSNIAKQWKLLISEKQFHLEETSGAPFLSIRYSRNMFTIISTIMALQNAAYNNSTLSQYDFDWEKTIDRLQSFSKGKDIEVFFQETVTELILLVIEVTKTVIALMKSADHSVVQLSEVLNINLANFISDLFEIISPTHSFQLVASAIGTYDFEHRHQQLAFLRVLGQSPLFTTLSCPPEMAYKISEILHPEQETRQDNAEGNKLLRAASTGAHNQNSGSTSHLEYTHDYKQHLGFKFSATSELDNVLQFYLERHFLAAVFLCAIKEAFASGSVKQIVIASRALHSVLHIQELDTHFDGMEGKISWISQLYLPFLLIVQSYHKNVQNVHNDEHKRILCSVIVKILRSLEPEVILDWIETSNEDAGLTLLLDLIASTSISFVKERQKQKDHQTATDSKSTTRSRKADFVVFPFLEEAALDPSIAYYLKFIPKRRATKTTLSADLDIFGLEMRDTAVHLLNAVWAPLCTVKKKSIGALLVKVLASSTGFYYSKSPATSRFVPDSEILSQFYNNLISPNFKAIFEEHQDIMIQTLEFFFRLLDSSEAALASSLLHTLVTRTLQSGIKHLQALTLFTWEASRFIAKYSFVNIQNLATHLRAIQSDREHFGEVIITLSEIFLATWKVSTGCTDLVCDGHLKLIGILNYFPKSQMDLAKKISIFHEVNKNVLEAGQAKLLMAGMSMYFQKMCGKTEFEFSKFYEVCPLLRKMVEEGELVDSDDNMNAQDIESSDFFRCRFVIRCLCDALDLLSPIHPGLCSKIYALLFALYDCRKEEKSDEEDEEEATRRHAAKNLPDPSDVPVGNYYLVTFFGPKFSEINNSEIYVYQSKYPPDNFLKRLIGEYQEQISAEVVEFSQDEAEEEQPNERHMIQLVPIQPVRSSPTHYFYDKYWFNPSLAPTVIRKQPSQEKALKTRHKSESAIRRPQRSKTVGTTADAMKPDTEKENTPISSQASMSPSASFKKKLMRSITGDNTESSDSGSAKGTPRSSPNSSRTPKSARTPRTPKTKTPTKTTPGGTPRVDDIFAPPATLRGSVSTSWDPLEKPSTPASDFASTPGMESEAKGEEREGLESSSNPALMFHSSSPSRTRPDSLPLHGKIAKGELHLKIAGTRARSSSVKKHRREKEVTKGSRNSSSNGRQKSSLTTSTQKEALHVTKQKVTLQISLPSVELRAPVEKLRSKGHK